ncbi:hypothetical protein K8I28_17125 [bacterium]|nr:hypothetical protein [bacterium]
MRKHTYIKVGIFILLVVLVSGFTMIGCGDLEGTEKENQRPNVSFVTVPLDSSQFSAAPILYWKGNDPDGFVEYYSYADVTDSAAFDNPQAYASEIPEEEWTSTNSTEERIYLLTPAGEIQKHIFYIRCFDDQGEASDIKYRTFFRSNQPPNIPEIGMVGMTDDEIGNSVYVADTLYSGESITATWPGIQFTWRGNDPDDRSLYKIPLEFQPILVKAPGDTIFKRPFSDNLGIVLANLETGFYTLYVWARDDGLTLSTAPARIEFNVIKPTFENRMLLVVEALERVGQGRPEPDSLKHFYNRLLTDVLGENIVADTVDVRQLMLTDINNRESWISNSLVHQYKLVIFANDQFKRLNYQVDDYTSSRNQILIDYLRVGGRLWYQGRMVGKHALDTTNTGSDDGALLLDEYLFADSLSGRPLWTEANLPLADFIGTRSALPQFRNLTFDTSKVGENYLLPTYAPNNFGLSGAEIIARKPGASTTQYFISLTDTLVVAVEDEDSEVLTRVTLREGTAQEQTFDYPPTQTDCYIRTINDKVYTDGVTSIQNLTLLNNGEANWEGEPIEVNDYLIRVSYSEGEPWSDDDVLAVDYRYDPLTRYHLKPVEIRYERGEVVNFTFSQLRYRTALTSFSYYFVEYDDVVECWDVMLEWFYDPNLHF